MANLSDTIKMSGWVTIESIDTTGRRETLLNEENLIVTSGRMSLANQLAHATGSGLSIYDVAFGDQGVLPNNAASAKTISPGETSVIHQIPGLVPGTDYIFSIKSVETVAPKVVVSITVPTVSALNGVSLNEMALLLQTGPTGSTNSSGIVIQAGDAFSIKRFPSILKSDSISLIITWTIYV